MNDDEISQFYLALIELLSMTKQSLFKLAGTYGLTNIQATVLLMLRHLEEPPAMQALAGTLGCDASNITGIVDLLESKKMVSRQEKPGDRRVKVIQIEPAGREISDELLTKAAQERSKSFAANLTSEEMQTFARLVHKLNQSAQ